MKYFENINFIVKGNLNNMSMTIRERILAVYRGEIPDVVPYMLDLSHWFYHKNKMSWDLRGGYDEPERGLIDYHKQAGVGFYVPNQTSFYSIANRDDVKIKVKKDIVNGNPEITWRYETPLGSIERTRIWEEGSYSWAIKDWGIKTEDDLRILGYAMSNRTCIPNIERYKSWAEYIGDNGVVYIPLEYSGMGYLLSYWMGIEGTIYAVNDWPDTMHEIIDQINKSILDYLDIVLQVPAEVFFLGDNFSSDIQPPSFFNEWSKPFYDEGVRRIHAAGKYVSVHIDGKLRGALNMIRETGADCADAVTPTPMGDLTPEQCRKEAGPDFILSGGVSPDLWLPSAEIKDFKEAVINWLGLKKHSPRLIAAAGDQVPPGAEEERIYIMLDLVEEFGRF